MDNNLWSRRSNSSKLSLSTGSNGAASSGDHTQRNFGSVRKGDTSAHSNRNPFNSPSVTSLASPTAGASSAFGLGSGAFASFGASKTPKTPGTALDFGGALGISKQNPPAERSVKAVEKQLGDLAVNEQPKPKTADELRAMKLRYTWVQWVRPPVQKSSGYVDYEQTIKSMVQFSNVNDFWLCHRHLSHPSTLPVVTDRHIFKEGIRPIWEDEDNKNGGKWELRLKKGIVDRYFEETQLALIGNLFDDLEEICGAVVSVRNGEDILSIWVRNDSSKNVRIREQWKKFLGCPDKTVIEWKSHDTSLQNRATIDQARKQHNQQTSLNHGKDVPSTPSSEKKQAS